MAERYYPEFYLRKRQKEAVFKRITWGVAFVGICAFAVVVGFWTYKTWLEPRRTLPGATPAIADARTEGRTEQRLEGIQGQPATGQVEAAPNLDELPYGQSFPELTVSLAGNGAVPAADPAAEQLPADAATPAIDPAVDPNAAPSTPYDTLEPPATAPQDEPQTEPAVDPKPPAAKPKDKPAEKPKDKPAEKPKDKPKDEPKPKPEAKPDTPPAGPAGSTFVYKVYAGSFASEEAARQRRDELKSLGYAGSVIKTGGDYNLLITELDDLGKAAAMVKELKSSGFSAAYSTRVTKKK